MNKLLIICAVVAFALVASGQAQALEPDVWVDDDMTIELAFEIYRDEYEGSLGFWEFMEKCIDWEINGGIGKVADGGTVYVGAGTYEEDLVIDISVDLWGDDGAASTIIKGVANVDAGEFPLAVPNIQVVGSNVEIHGFTIQGPDPVAGKYSSGIVIGGDNVEIHHNVFQVTNASSLDDISQGIQTYRDGNAGAGDLDGLNIHDNTFAALGAGTHGYEAIFINHTPSGASPAGVVTIANNQIGGVLLRGITTERSNMAITGNTVETTLDPWDGEVGAGAFQGILVMDFSGREQRDVAVAGNTISGSSGFSQGLRIGTAGQTLANISVTGNTVQGNDKGIQVRASGVVVNNCNKIIGNATSGVENTDAAVLDATDNWWGDASGPSGAGPGTGDAVVGNVDFFPWYIDPDCENFEPPYGETAVVAVNDDWEGLEPGTIVTAPFFDPAGYRIGINAFDEVQVAIDAVDEGGTVNVLPGTYTEDLFIDNNDLEIVAVTAGATIKGVLTSVPNIDIQTYGVKISGLTIQSPDVPDGECSSGIVLAGTDIELCNNKFVSNAAGNGSCVVIQNVAGSESDISGLNIHDNEFVGTPGGGYVGVFINHTNVGTGAVTIQDNTLGGNIVQGVVTERSNTVIRGNTITGSEYGIGIGTTGQTLTNIVVTRNTLEDNGVGVQVRASAGGVVVNNNDMSGNTYGVENTDAGIPYVPCDTLDPEDPESPCDPNGQPAVEEVPTGVLDATLNWWGHASGPYHPTTNSYGKGDEVSDNVVYLPWLNAPDGEMFTGVFIDFNANDTHDSGEPIFVTIQDAIDAAFDGDIIVAGPGTYNANLVIDKSGITLRSIKGRDKTTIVHQSDSEIGVDFRAGADNCVLGGEAGHGFTMKKDSAGCVIQLTDAPSGVVISDNTIDNTGLSSIGIVGADGLLQVIKNKFIADEGDCSVYGWSATNMTVFGNTFTGPGKVSGCAVQFDGMNASYIANNTIDGYGTGIFLQTVEESAGVSDVTISNNRVRYCVKGVRLGFDPEGNAEVRDVTVTDNELSFNTVGIYVSDSNDVVADTFVIKDNRITENTDGLTNANDVYDVDATLNWWGDPSGPSGEGTGSGDTVSVKVDYDPWWVCGDTVNPCPIGDLSHDDQVDFADFAIFADNWLEGATP